MSDSIKRMSISMNVSFADAEDDASYVEISSSELGVVIDINNGVLSTSPNYKQPFYWDSITLEEAKQIVYVLNYFINNAE